MKNVWKKIGALLTVTCVLFTVMFVSLYTIGVLAGRSGWLFDIGKMYMILLFAFILALCGLFFSSPKIPLWRAYLLHFLACAAAYYLIFIYWMGFSSKSGQVLLLFALFLIIYGIYFAVSLSVRRGGTRKKAEEKPYESAFSVKK